MHGPCCAGCDLYQHNQKQYLILESNTTTGMENDTASNSSTIYHRASTIFCGDILRASTLLDRRSPVGSEEAPVQRQSGRAADGDVNVWMRGGSQAIRSQWSCKASGRSTGRYRSRPRIAHGSDAIKRRAWQQG